MFGALFFVDGKRLWPFWFGYHMLVLLITSFIIVLDFELYKHWGFRLDATPILYMGKEAAGSGDLWKSILLIIYWLVIFSVSVFLIYKYFRPKFLALPASNLACFPGASIRYGAPHYTHSGQLWRCSHEFRVRLFSQPQYLCESFSYQRCLEFCICRAENEQA